MTDSSAKLVIVGGPLPPREFPLDDLVTTIGRTADNDVVLDDRSISRLHARIEVTDEGFLVVDQGSQNGTFVRGQRITQKVVQPGEDIAFGQIACRIVADGAASAASAGAGVPAQSDWSNIPQQYRPLTADDLLDAADVQAQAQGSAGLSAEAVRRRGLILYIASLAGVVIVGLLLVMSIQMPRRPMRRSVILHVGQTRLVGVRSAVKRMGLIDEILVDEPTVVDAAKDKEMSAWLIAIKGKSPGVTDIFLSNRRGVVCVITAKVAPKPTERRRYDPSLTDEQRARKGLALLLQAQSAQKDHPWLALEKYQRAKDILGDIQPTPPTFYDARQGVVETTKTITRLYESLKGDFGVAFRNRRYQQAAHVLQQIKDLVRDPDDLRYQRAELLMPMVLKELKELEALKRR